MWCREHRHDSIKEQQRMLSLKLRGHYAYYGITGNAARLQVFWHEVFRIWRYWLCRRSRKARLSWDAFNRLINSEVSTSDTCGRPLHLPTRSESVS